eukprot:TRINITY_DN6050_c3_g1_i1.p1 TRINITY_DN6050_c3_g1~~TRINITY_DN6050_c3_g1_i1.p1  ORF type:complete len:517 (+),score=141.60 TRINITY_DN6050_c3_g1_i1:72-1553(+)
MDEDEERKKAMKRRGPMVVPRKNTTVQKVTTSHDIRKAKAEEEKRFVAAPRKRVVVQAGLMPTAGGGGGGQDATKMLSLTTDNGERTGFDVLQHSYDKDTYPTTLPGADTTDEPAKIGGYVELQHTISGDAQGGQERRFCEITQTPSGLAFVHKLRPDKSDNGKQIPMAYTTCKLLEDSKVEFINDDDKVVLVAESPAEAQAWCDAISKAAKQAESDKIFETYLNETYGTGLDFLAEVEKEERTRVRNNQELFPSHDADIMREDELFLIQLPHMLPGVVASQQQARRTATPPPRQAGAPPGQMRSTSAPAKQTDDKSKIAHKPGTSWTGRALGSSEHKSSLATRPSGKVGKIYVRKSGKIEMKMGECSFDISSGGEATYAQTLMGVYTVDKKYRADGWGPSGCPVYSTPSLQNPTMARKSDGEVIAVVKEQDTPSGYFYCISNNGGWVLRESPTGGTWASVGNEGQGPRAYELGQIARKIVVTPNFDHFDDDV